MDVEISTSDPDHVDPARVAAALQAANFFVLTVTVNEDIDGAWTYDPDANEEQLTTDLQRERYRALTDNGVEPDAALKDARTW